ncbi:MAG: heavy-metal-associated domain-containing protein [Spirochaetes bacterium]|jgi:Cu2+-exporting ATPase|nr:heavy-metal-associated domain-containing protein [Spirochaetota bacterium]
MKFIVGDMSCQHCVRRITEAVGRVSGVTNVSIDLERKLVEVNGTADTGAVINAIKSAGYTAVPES